MATKKTGTLVVRGTSGRVGKMVLPAITDLAAAKTFGTAMESSHIDGKVTAAAWSESEKIPAVITAGNTDRKGIIVYNDSATQTTKRVSIPSWKTDATNSVQQQEGERIPIAACQAVVGALATASGKTLTALEGYVIQGR